MSINRYISVYEVAGYESPNLLFVMFVTWVRARPIIIVITNFNDLFIHIQYFLTSVLGYAASKLDNVFFFNISFCYFSFFFISSLCYRFNVQPKQLSHLFIHSIVLFFVVHILLQIYLFWLYFRVAKMRFQFQFQVNFLLKKR